VTDMHCPLRITSAERRYLRLRGIKLSNRTS